MAVSFHSLNYPSHILGYAKKNRVQGINPILAVPPPSIILQTDESGSFPNLKPTCGLVTASLSCDSRNYLLSQANSVGIIGGVSNEATLIFVNKLVKWSSKEEENNSLPFVLCSDPALNKDLLSYERNSLVSLTGKSEHFQVDETWIVENLRRKRVFLENSGARCIVMPCHISHSWHQEVSEGCSVPFLHVGECVARELKDAKLRPLEAGSPLRIGVIASDTTLRAGFYQGKLQNEGFEVVLPDKATMEHIIIPAIKALCRKDMEGACNLLRIALQVLLVRAVNTVILASDDMWKLLPPDDPLLTKCVVDPMDALARATIKFAQSDHKLTLTQPNQKA